MTTNWFELAQTLTDIRRESELDDRMIATILNANHYCVKFIDEEGTHRTVYVVYDAVDGSYDPPIEPVVTIQRVYVLDAALDHRPLAFGPSHKWYGKLHGYAIEDWFAKQEARQ